MRCLLFVSFPQTLDLLTLSPVKPLGTNKRVVGPANDWKQEKVLRQRIKQLRTVLISEAESFFLKTLFTPFFLPSVISGTLSGEHSADTHTV